MKYATLTLILSAILFLVGCSGGLNTAFDPSSGCILQKVELKGERFQGQSGYVGYCLDESFVVRWEVQHAKGSVWYQAVRTKEGKVKLQYRTPDFTWVEWSAKGGLEVVVPEEFNK